VGAKVGVVVHDGDERRRAIFTAAAHAQRAFDFLNSLQSKTDAPREAEQLAA
jgi:antirestriction protein ArdC